MNNLNTALDVGILILAALAVAEFVRSILSDNTEIKRLRKLTKEAKEELNATRKEHSKFLELVDEQQTNPGIRDTTETIH